MGQADTLDLDFPNLDMQIASQDTVSREFWLDIWKILELQIVLDPTSVLDKSQ